MKKILFSAAILAAFASCSKNETAKVATTGEIAFSTLNDRVTKAANDANDNYMVYATSTVATTNWFIAEEVYGAAGAAKAGGDAAEDAIVSENKYYYLPGEQGLNVYAYAPASAVTATATTVGKLSIDYTVPGDEDLTAAIVKGTTKEQISLEFKHMLSKVTVATTVNENLAGYTVTPAGTATLVTADSDGVLDVTAPSFENGEATAATYSGAESYMVLPQVGTGCTIALEDVVIATAEGDEIYNGDLSALAFPADFKFEAGKHYVVTIDITKDASDDEDDPIFGAEISFVSSIANWDDDATGNVEGNDVALAN